MSSENDDVNTVTSAIAAGAERICSAITSSVGLIILTSGSGTDATMITGAVLVVAGLIRATVTVHWEGFIGYVNKKS